MATQCTQQIIEAVASGAQERVITSFEFGGSGMNELLFFFKPGCFRVKESRNLDEIINMAMHKIEAHHASVTGAILLSGQRLDELGIMDRHYGYINRLSKQASKILHDEDRQRIYHELGITANFEDYPIMGGHEFLQRFPTHNYHTLHDMWISKHSHKLRSGFYVQQYDVEEGEDEQQVVIINGFHPSQLAVFTHPDHKIVALLLQSDTDWHDLKFDLAGDTFPDKAKSDSIRGELFARHEHYGVHAVTVSNNMVHLSAGPFEALFELDNFFHRLPSANFNLFATNMAKRMQMGGWAEQDVTRCLSNPKAMINGRDTDLFSATEDKNSDVALEAYAAYFAKTA